MVKNRLTPKQKIALYNIFSSESMFSQEGDFGYLEPILTACKYVDNGLRIQKSTSYLNDANFNTSLEKYGFSNIVFYDGIDSPIFCASLSDEQMDDLIYTVVDNLINTILNKSSFKQFSTIFNSDGDYCYQYSNNVLSFYDCDDWRIFYSILSKGLKSHYYMKGGEI